MGKLTGLLALASMVLMTACQPSPTPPRPAPAPAPNCSQPDVLAGSVSVSDGVERLVVARGSDPVRRVHPEWLLLEPAFSPDGERVVVTRATKGDYESAGPDEVELWIMDLDGSHARALTDGRREVSSPSWSPNGKTILFREVRDGRWQLASIAADGSAKPRALHTEADLEWWPRWSPDGTRISYVRTMDAADPDATFQLVMARTDGTHPKVLATFAAPARYVWNPDGHSFTVADGGRLTTVDLSGIHRDLGVAGTPAGWSADRKRLYFADPLGKLGVGTINDGRLAVGTTAKPLRTLPPNVTLSPKPAAGC